MVPLPLTDHIRRRSFWFVTLTLIAMNVWAFFLELAQGRDLNRLVFLLNHAGSIRHAVRICKTNRGKLSRSYLCFHVPAWGVAAPAWEHALLIRIRAQR